MEIHELSHDEQLALVALVGIIIESDAELSDDEVEQLSGIVDQIGDDEYRTLAEEADERFNDEGELKEFLLAIQRQEARELIFAKTLETALPDGMALRESSLLDWLETAWKIRLEIGDDSE